MSNASEQINEILNKHSQEATKELKAFMLRNMVNPKLELLGTIYGIDIYADVIGLAPKYKKLQLDRINKLLKGLK